MVTMANMKQSELSEQIKLFRWAATNEHIWPELALMYHTPNEGKRTNGAILKAAGMKKGVPDICLPIPQKGYHGLYIELKKGNRKPTPEQEHYMAILNTWGYKALVCRGAEAAKTVILEYLRSPGQLAAAECVAAPWQYDRCHGLIPDGGILPFKECQRCCRHDPTREERIIAKNLESAPKGTKKNITTAIMVLQDGENPADLTAGDVLETVSAVLAILVKRGKITIDQSADILEIAMKAYKCGADKRRHHEKEDENHAKKTE